MALFQRISGLSPWILWVSYFIRLGALHYDYFWPCGWVLAPNGLVLTLCFGFHLSSSIDSVLLLVFDALFRNLLVSITQITSVPFWALATFFWVIFVWFKVIGVADKHPRTGLPPVTLSGISILVPTIPVWSIGWLCYWKVVSILWEAPFFIWVCVRLRDQLLLFSARCQRCVPEAVSFRCVISPSTAGFFAIRTLLNAFWWKSLCISYTLFINHFRQCLSLRFSLCCSWKFIALWPCAGILILFFPYAAAKYYFRF